MRLEPEAPVALVIPAFEPTMRLAGLLEEFAPSWRGPIVVVDDGSTTSEASAALDAVRALPGVTLLAHERNRGKGAALKTAFAHLAAALAPAVRPDAAPAEFPDAAPAAGGLAGVVTADADGQHLPADILAVAEALRAHPDALVLGCRDFGREGIPARSLAGNRAMCVAMRVFCGVSVSDTQTGLRGIPLGFARELLAVHGDGYEFETTMLVEASRGGIPFVEVPITTVYEGKNEVSHFNPVLDSLRVAAVLVGAFAKYAVSSVASSLVDWLAFAALMALLAHAPLGGWTIAVSTLGARVVSAAFNFVTNRRVVFKAHGNARRSAARYAALCVACVCASAALVTLVSRVLPVPAIAVKPVVDTALFFVNYRVQQAWVFR